jgi:RHH-type rel operon transcriptional repressor/antitoxin RelB
MPKAAKKPTVTTTGVRLPTKTRSRLQKLATATERSQNFLIVEAIEQFLDINEWQIQAIKASLDDPRDTVDGDAVDAWLATWGSADEKPPPW